MTNIYRRALEGVFSGIMRTGKNIIGGPLAGLGSGILGKELSEKAVRNLGMDSGLGKLTYKASNLAGKAVNRVGRGAAEYAYKGSKAGTRGAYEFAREAVPEMSQGAKKLWRGMTVEAADEPLGRMLRPSVQTAGAAGIMGFGVMSGLGAYNSAIQRAPADLGDNLITSGYDGRVNKRAMDSTVGLVQALNDLR